MTGTTIGLLFDQRFTLLGLESHLKAKFSAKVVGTASSKEDATKFLQTTRPKLVMMDTTLQGSLCLDLISHISSRLPQTHVLVMSGQSESVFAERCLRSGARGYVGGNWDLDEIDNAIETVLAGEVYLSKQSQRNLIGRMVGRDKTAKSHPVETLTQRELQVFVRTGYGLPPREIASELDLCVKTIETYRDKIKEKLGLRSSHRVAMFAMECVLLDFHESAQQFSFEAGSK